jgi:TetR/AcrR family transcriptional repressor of nem operon
MARRNDKREKLVVAANDSFRERGVDSTTLANIAQLATVPLGNVYYYFKSKESIVFAVLDHRRKQIQQQFEELAAIPDVLTRLKTLVTQSVSYNEATQNYGDALGSLCQELGRQGGEIAKAAATLMSEILDWCERQFKALGKEDKAKQLAMILVSSMQGISLLTLTFKNPEYTKQQATYLLNWLESEAGAA